MLASNTLSRMHMVAEGIHDVIHLHFLSDLNMAHIYHSYKHLVYTLYKGEEKYVQMIMNPAEAILQNDQH